MSNVCNENTGAVTLFGFDPNALAAVDGAAGLEWLRNALRVGADVDLIVVGVDQAQLSSHALVHIVD